MQHHHRTRGGLDYGGVGYGSSIRDSASFFFSNKTRSGGRGLGARKPPAPPTASPPTLDEDFDAITRTTGEGWPGSRTRSSAIPRPRSNNPLPDDFDADTYVATPPPPPKRRGGNGFENYTEYGNYMNEMEKMFGGGGGGDLEVSVRRLGGLSDEERRRSRQIGRVKGSGNGNRRRTNNYGSSRNNDGRGLKGVQSIARPGRHGPRAGQDYEVVTQRILEDGPDRTVTISTWREQVAREADPDERMSVYFVDAGVYPMDLEAEENQRDENQSRSAEGRRSGSSKKGSLAGSGAGDEGVILGFERRPTPPPKSTSRSSHEHERQRQGSRHSSMGREPAQRTITTSSVGEPQRTITSSSSSRSWNRPEITRAFSPYRQQQQQSPRAPTASSSTPGSNSAPRSSTPIRQSPSRDDDGRDGTHHQQQESTPIKARMSPRPSFHPTRSGSTISSISVAKSPSSLRVSLERILDSCEPPIGHIGPALARLGITSSEHLVAVRRLSEETRDREVKEEAVRMGVTIMEWALLLDKIQHGL